jgi:hypothetical protein
MRSAQSSYMPKDIRTDVYVYLGDCSGDSLPLVCEGVSLVVDATTWQRARLALRHPTPRGPFPVGAIFTIFVHETSTSDSRILSTLRVDVLCTSGFAHASVLSTQPRLDLEPVPFIVGDDVVTIARKIVENLA